MNFKKYLMYMMILACLAGGISTNVQANEAHPNYTRLVEHGTPLTPNEQKYYKNDMMKTPAWVHLPNEVKDGLNFSKSRFMYKVKYEDGHILYGLEIPLEGKFEEQGLTLSFQNNRGDMRVFGVRHSEIKPEYVVPQYPQNEAYKKLSEKRFILPPSAQKELTPEQFEEVTTLMRIVKKDIDFLMNEPFGKIIPQEMKSGKYIGMLYPTHTPYGIDKYYRGERQSYFKERETPLEFEINNKLGRFLTLAEISTFDNKINCFGECPDTANYSTEGGSYLIFGLRLIPNGWATDEDIKGMGTNATERKEIAEAFPKLIEGIGAIIKERGVDPENLPNIKNPNVPVYDKCLAYIYMQAKEVHDIVMNTKILLYIDNPVIMEGTLADYISIDPKNPGLIKQDKTKIAKAKNNPKRHIGRQK